MNRVPPRRACRAGHPASCHHALTIDQMQRTPIADAGLHQLRYLLPGSGLENKEEQRSSVGSGYRVELSILPFDLIDMHDDRPDA